jgi:hypothetical protein
VLLVLGAIIASVFAMVSHVEAEHGWLALLSRLFIR